MNPPEFIKMDRRRADPALTLIASRLESLHSDVGDMKAGLKDLAAAITKLAVVEERLGTSVQAQERAFAEIKDVRAEQKKIAERAEIDHKKISDRVEKLEQAAPLQKKASDWTFNAIWAAAGTAVGIVLHKIGLI